MYRSILITFTGITAYFKAMYCDGEKEYENYQGSIPLSVNVIPQHQGGRNLSEIYCFATPEVLGAEINPDTISDYGEIRSFLRDSGVRNAFVNNYEYLKREIQQSVPAASVQSILFNQNISGIDLYKMIDENILKRTNDKILLYVDTTNCFRSIPISMFTVLNLIEKNYPHVKIRGIYYWKDANKTVSGIRYYELDDLLETFNEKHIAEEIDQFSRTYYMSDIERYLDTTNENVKMLCQELKKISDAVQYVNIMDLVNHIRTVISLAETLLSSNPGAVLEAYLRPLYETYVREYNDDPILMAINVAETMYSKKLIQLAATFMEAVYDQILIEAVKTRGYDIEVLDERVQYSCIKVVEANLQLRKDFRQYRSIDADIRNLKRVHNPPEDKFFEICSQLNTAYKDLWRVRPSGGRTVLRGSINSFLENVRNPMNHGDGTKEANTDAYIKDFIKAIDELYARLVEK